MQTAQQAEEGAEVGHAGDGRHGGGTPLRAAARQSVDQQRDGHDDERAGEQHPDHLRKGARGPSDPLREQVTRGVRKRGAETDEDGEHER